MLCPAHIACNGCGTVKNENNHWFRVVTTSAEPSTLKITSVPNIVPLDSQIGTSHYCGEECLLKGISRSLKECKI